MFDGGVEGVTVDVNEGLREIAGELELGYVVVCLPKLSSKVKLFKLSLARQDVLNSYGKVLVALGFVFEELGAFGCFVDDL